MLLHKGDMAVTTIVWIAIAIIGLIIAIAIGLKAAGGACGLLGIGC